MNEDEVGRHGEDEDEEEVLLRADYLMRRHKGGGDPPGQPARSSPRDIDEIPLLTDLVSPGTRPLDTDPAQLSPVPPTPEGRRAAVALPGEVCTSSIERSCMPTAGAKLGTAR